MRLSPATRLSDRQTVWVAYRNDGSKFIPTNLVNTAAGWAAQFSDTYADDVQPSAFG